MSSWSAARHVLALAVLAGGLACASCSYLLGIGDVTLATDGGPTPDAPDAAGDARGDGPTPVDALTPVDAPVNDACDRQCDAIDAALDVQSDTEIPPQLDAPVDCKGDDAGASCVELLGGLDQPVAVAVRHVDGGTEIYYLNHGTHEDGLWVRRADGSKNLLIQADHGCCYCTSCGGNVRPRAKSLVLARGRVIWDTDTHTDGMQRYTGRIRQGTSAGRSRASTTRSR